MSIFAAGGSNTTHELARLVSRIGYPDFDDQLLRLYQVAIRANHLGLILVGSGNQLKEWRVLDTCRRMESIGVMNQFLSRVWPRDSRLFLDGAQVVGSNSMSRRRAKDIADSEYRELCYTQPGVIDRLVMTSKEASETLHVCAYRRDSSRCFSESEIQIAARLAPLALAACNRHLQSFGSGDKSATDSLTADSPSLSSRERQVANRIAQGVTSREIAAELGISRYTVLTYRQRVYEKLGVRSQREMLAQGYGGRCA